MVSYAFGGEQWQPGASGLEFAKPIPVHAQTRAALQAVEAVRRHGVERRLERELDRLVTDVGNPGTEPYLVTEYRVTRKGKRKPTGRLVPGEPVTRNARALLALAESKGLEAHIVTSGAHCLVEGISRAGGYAFRATWRAGRATSATWHEREYRYGMMTDTRPEGVSATSRVALAGKRGAGLGRLHLTILASPLGVSLTQAALIEKVKAL